MMMMMIFDLHPPNQHKNLKDTFKGFSYISDYYKDDRRDDEDMCCICACVLFIRESERVMCVYKLREGTISNFWWRARDV